MSGNDTGISSSNDPRPQLQLAQIIDSFSNCNKVSNVRRTFHVEDVIPSTSPSQSYQRLSISSLCNEQVDQARNTTHTQEARTVEHIDNTSKVRDELSERVKSAQEDFRIVDENYSKVREQYIMLEEERKKARKHLQDAVSKEKSFEIEQIKSSREQIKQETQSKLHKLREAEQAIKRRYERQDSTSRLSIEELIDVSDDDLQSHISLSEEEGGNTSQNSETSSNEEGEGIEEQEEEKQEEDIDTEDDWSEQEVITLIRLYDSNIALDDMIRTLKHMYGTNRTMQECNEKYRQKAAEIWGRRVISLDFQYTTIFKDVLISRFLQGTRSSKRQLCSTGRRLRPRQKQNYCLMKSHNKI